MTIQDSLLLFAAAFSASLSHCAGMCGGLVLALNLKNLDFPKQVLANCLYYAGRLCGYLLVGLAFSLIGVNLALGGMAEGFIFIGLGILLLASAFYFTFPGVIKAPSFLKKLGNSGFQSRFYKESLGRLLSWPSLSRFFVIGILNGFLPCGLVYTFAIQAANRVNVLEGLLSMLIFGFATFLPLFLVGIFSARLLSSRLRSVLLKVSFVLLLYFAGNSIYKGYTHLSGSPSPHSHTSATMDSQSHTESKSMHDDQNMPSDMHSHH